MPATDTPHTLPRPTGSLLPNLLLERPGSAIRREPVLQLGFDRRSGTYHLSIASPQRTL